MSRDSDLLRDQRDANERLVLATIEAHERVELARDARDSAQQTAGELRQATEELRSVAEFRELLIGIVSHDLRNPLNTVLIASDLLLASGALSEPNARLVGRIVTSGERMGRMIAQLLEFTRARSGGGFTLALALCDLGDISRNIADELRIGAAAQIRLSVEGDLRGTWDADRLAAVVSNLAGNAVDHATAGTPIRIDARADGASVVVAITNEGPTIPAELLAVIFKAFRRANDATSSNKHVGLGLYISSEIVKAHGGVLDACSSDGTTTFTVRLPRVAAPPPAKLVA